MDIANKAEHDPVADLSIADAYMCWALLAAEEAVNKQGLDNVLKQVGLERFIGHYPPNELKVVTQIPFSDYSTLLTGLLSAYGRAGKNILMRVGRQSAKYGIEQQGALFGLAALAAVRLLPMPTQIKMGLENMQGGFRKVSQSVGQDMRLRIEDRGGKWAYVAEDCPMCAGKHADEHICMAFTGILMESALWLTGKEIAVEEVECRSMGAPACVWEVSKTPKE